MFTNYILAMYKYVFNQALIILTVCTHEFICNNVNIIFILKLNEGRKSSLVINYIYLIMQVG